MTGGKEYCSENCTWISVKVRLDQGETKIVKIGRGVRQRCSLSPTVFNLYSEYFTNESL